MLNNSHFYSTMPVAQAKRCTPFSDMVCGFSAVCRSFVLIENYNQIDKKLFAIPIRKKDSVRFRDGKKTEVDIKLR